MFKSKAAPARPNQSRRGSLDNLPTYSKDNSIYNESSVNEFSAASKLPLSDKSKFMLSQPQYADESSDETKEYHSLFWMPMVMQTAIDLQDIVEDMISMIDEFHDVDIAAEPHGSFISIDGNKHRRGQILGDIDEELDEVTRVDVVLKSESTKSIILSVLKKHFLFSQMQQYELEDIIMAMGDKYVDEDEIIIREGDVGDVFYVLEEGSVEILVEGTKAGELHAMDSFGDLAIMYNCPRAATIKAKSECTLWCLDRIFFRRAMVTSSSRQNSNLAHFLRKINLFESVPTSTLYQLGRSLSKKAYDDDDFIIKQGEIGEQFFIIHKGAVKVTKVVDGASVELIKLKAGDVFGERALIKKEPRAANVVAVGTVECYYLNKDDFAMILGDIVEKLTTMNEVRVLRPAVVFKEINDTRLKQIASTLKKEQVFKGQRVICMANYIYIILSGNVESSKGKVYSDGNVIGDFDGCAADIAGALTILSDEAVTVALSRDDIYEHISAQRSEVEELAEEMAPTHSKGNVFDGDDFNNSDVKETILEGVRKRRLTSSRRRSSVTTHSIHLLSDFTIINRIGMGTFAMVYSVRSKENGKSYALKCLDKKSIVDQKHVSYVKRELIALQVLCFHPFICTYYNNYLTKDKIMILLEEVGGGDFWQHLYKSNMYKVGPYGGLTLVNMGHYSAMIILALEHIHDHGYVFRDLKPENILIDSSGYLKLCDFGLAKAIPFVNKHHHIQYRTFTLCGTPEYIAPEIVLTQGHDKTADFWALGVLMYELLCKRTPFDGRNQQRVFEKIVHSQKFLAFPSKFDPHCKSMIRRLLHKSAGLRLGALQHGYKDLKQYTFFETNNINFNNILNKEIKMEFIPIINERYTHLSNKYVIDDSFDHEILEEEEENTSGPFQDIARIDIEEMDDDEMVVYEK